ncbi:MAG: pyridoxine 5'-phosphate synthase [Bacteroidia bacterium]|nr:pyridoxine 5'-phosphate synthase [Sphingobacteriia bacterium]
MTRLSVNVNKIALLRNSRDHGVPDPVQFALDCERFGADGITVHPRPDARHIRPDDVRALRHSLSTELNVEGNPLESYYMDLVLEVRPAQATLVPDHPLQRTSDHGWDLEKDGERLRPIIAELKAAGIRVSLFIDPNPRYAEQAAELGAQAVELYTEDFARCYDSKNSTEGCTEPYEATYRRALDGGLLVNAGHDLNLSNLSALNARLPLLHEVSIGHALVADALYLGLENTVRLYRHALHSNAPA